MRMPANSGLSENVESFNNLQHDTELCLNETSHNRGAGVKAKIGSFCILLTFCVLALKLYSKAVAIHIMNKTNLADFFWSEWLSVAQSSLVKGLNRAYHSPPRPFSSCIFSISSLPSVFPLIFDDPLFTLAALSEPFLSNSINSLPRSRNGTAHHYYVIQHLYLNSVEIHRRGLGRRDHNKTYNSGVYSFKSSFLLTLSTHSALNKYSYHLSNSTICHLTPTKDVIV